MLCRVYTEVILTSVGKIAKYSFLRKRNSVDVIFFPLNLKNIIYFLNVFFKLEDNCLTILCWYSPCINMNQLKVHRCPLPLEAPSRLPPPPTPLGNFVLVLGTQKRKLCDPGRNV